MYTKEELIAAAEKLGYRKVVVAAALMNQKEEYFSLEEAKIIIDQFLGKVVQNNG